MLPISIWSSGSKKVKIQVQPEAEVLVLAGDTHTSPDGIVKYLKKLRREGVSIPIILVPGNHEYYKHDFNTVRRSYEKTLDSLPGVYWLDNNLVILGGVKFIGSTLYTDLSNPIAALYAKKNLTDFRVVTVNGHNFTTDQWTDLYWINYSFIETCLNISSRRTVVVTHMLPSWSLITEKFKGENTNAAFAVEMTDLMEKYKPAVWVYGHDHNPREDTRIYDTRVVCNQYGYYYEKLPYKPMIIDV